jgi:ceramide glucosyltransferase
LRPEALRVMLPYLYEPRVGAVFGLACYTDWSNLPSSLMSAFVNSNALLTYVPGTYLAEPFTITGHIFALRRETLAEAGAFAGLENNAGDDHVLARKIRGMGLRAVQTPMIYDVENHLTGMAAYAAQMKRWFIFPRQMLLPMLTLREKAVTFGLSAGNLIPGLLLLLSLFTRRRTSLKALGRSMAAFSAVYALCERLYLDRTTPLRRWPVVALSALVAPAHIAVALLSGNEVEWRGRHIRIEVGGDFTDVAT